MSRKFVLTVMLAAALMAFFVGIAYAGEEEPSKQKAYFVEDEDMGAIPIFGDGRINAFDMTQSFAVYYDRADHEVYNADGELEWQNVIVGLEVWVVDESTSVGQFALYVPASQINTALKSAADVQIAAANGVALSYLPGLDSFLVTGPRGYSFMWER